MPIPTSQSFQLKTVSKDGVVKKKQPPTAPLNSTAVLLCCLLRAMPVIGYLPQEILGTSCYEYFHQADLRHLSEKHRQGDGAEQPQSAFQVINLYLYAQKRSKPNGRISHCDDTHVRFISFGSPSKPRQDRYLVLQVQNEIRPLHFPQKPVV